MIRGISVAGMFLAMTLVTGAKADAPDFSGHWQIQPAASEEGRDHNISLDIQQDANNVTFSRVYREHGDKEVTAKFTCAVGAKECTFEDNGHKSSVSLWYDGPQLVILKTNGPKEDATVEWHLTLGADGKTLTVKRENISGDDKPEKLVFSKTASVATR